VLGVFGGGGVINQTTSCQLKNVTQLVYPHTLYLRKVKTLTKTAFTTF